MSYRNPARSAEERTADLLGRMTLDEKLGQMTQVEKNSLTPADVTACFVGSVLSGGGGTPDPNTAENWVRMTGAYQQAALATRLGIPLVYGVDAVHGHNNLYGATIFPHNVGLGAARDAGLAERVARATAAETAATGARWDFAPVVAVPQDIRWGRAYEAFGENTALVAELGAAYLRGLQNPEGGAPFSRPGSVLGTPKHYLADGGTSYGTSNTANTGVAYLLDQGDARCDEARLRALYLPPYRAAVEAGAQSIMVSFSSWNGLKMHAHHYLLTDVLKGELGFQGFLISDWQAIDQLPGDYFHAVATAINAGLDMIMVPFDYRAFLATLRRAVEQGAIPLRRIDDAVRRILAVKFRLGLFERPYPEPAELAVVGSAAHRDLAREAVRKSLVLLMNRREERGAGRGPTLPLAKDTPLVFVGGQAADNIGLQCGGWTIDWQGRPGSITPGTTILEGIRQAAGGRVEYQPQGDFSGLQGAQGQPLIADAGIAVVAETPYAEGIGDRADLTLPAADVALIERLRGVSRKLVLVVLSGRPLVLTAQLPLLDGLVAAWLPGTEGQGVADVLFGDFPFTGRLPYTWPRSMDQMPFDFATLAPDCETALFPYGYTAAEPLPGCEPSST